MYSMLGAVAMAVGNTNQVKEFVSTAKYGYCYIGSLGLFTNVIL
jgi:hypothetical protein